MSYVDSDPEEYSEHPQNTTASLVDPWANNYVARYHVGFGWKPDHVLPASYGYNTAELAARFGIEQIGAND